MLRTEIKYGRRRITPRSTYALTMIYRVAFPLAARTLLYKLFSTSSMFWMLFMSRMLMIIVTIMVIMMMAVMMRLVQKYFLVRLGISTLV